MTAAERVAARLACEFPGVNPALLARRPPFRAALAAALAVMSEAEVVEQIVGLGELTGARSPYGVLIARVRDLPALAEDRRRMSEDEAEAARWAAVDRAARRGETLRALVERGDLFADEAERMIASEFGDDDIRAIAEAALGGPR